MFFVFFPLAIPRSCWLSLEGGLLYAFVGPAAAVVLVRLQSPVSTSHVYIYIYTEYISEMQKYNLHITYKARPKRNSTYQRWENV